MFNIDSDYYVITWKHKNKRYFANADNGGYPYTSYDFSFDMVQYSLNSAKEYINIWMQFNMWKPEIGFLPSNIKIMKLDLKLIDI